MAKNVSFKLNLPGLNELMKSSEMEAALEQAGEAVAANAGSGYSHRVHQASFVAICNVYPDDAFAASDNYANNTLLKSLSAVGLPMTKGG